MAVVPLTTHNVSMFASRCSFKNFFTCRVTSTFDKVFEIAARSKKHGQVVEGQRLFSVIQHLLPPSISIHVCRNWMRFTREEGKSREEKTRRDEKRREGKGREEKRREEKRREEKRREEEEKRREEKWSLRLNLTQHGKTHQVLTQ